MWAKAPSEDGQPVEQAEDKGGLSCSPNLCELPLGEEPTLGSGPHQETVGGS